METLTRAELREELRDVKTYLGARVAAVDAKVEKINGRVYRHDRELGEQAAQLAELQRFRESIEIVAPEELSGPDSMITRRDLKIVIWTIVGLGAAIAGWQSAVEAILTWLKATLQ